MPDGLRTFHALTRSRRSSRDYSGLALARGDFDALLHTACGVTGAMPWAGREVKLRAYPSSGALYAVEIYPVVLRVEGVDPSPLSTPLDGRTTLLLRSAPAHRATRTATNRKRGTSYATEARMSPSPSSSRRRCGTGCLRFRRRWITASCPA